MIPQHLQSEGGQVNTTKFSGVTKGILDHILPDLFLKILKLFNFSWGFDLHYKYNSKPNLYVHEVKDSKISSQKPKFF